MFDSADADNLSVPSGSSQHDFSEELLHAAQDAVEAGNPLLGLHLYLAAFQKAASASPVPEEAAIDGLKQAWAISVSLHERSLCEYIFEKLDPFITNEEKDACASQLQMLAMDKLAVLGISREEIEEMTSALAEGLLGEDAQIVRIDHIIDGLHIPLPSNAKPEASSKSAEPAEPVDEQAPSADEPVESVESAESKGAAADSEQEKASGNPGIAALLKSAEQAGVRLSAPAEITYKDLAGYGKVVSAMRDFGIGMQNDEQFQSLVTMLNERYGLTRMPACDTLLFRSVAREDAEAFMRATLGEIGLPAIRMRMDENLQGQPVLCVLAHADSLPALNATRTEFSGRGVLVLEDIDLWIPPMLPEEQAQQPLSFAQMTRGAREAINLIRSSVLNPDVFVIATADMNAPIDEFFLDMLEPVSVVDIENPTPEERIEVWMDICHQHPSIRSIGIADLVRYSANMPRYDMYMASREAIDQAYKESLVQRRYVPVSRDNLFDKLAAYQPLDSREYKELENRIISDFRRELVDMNEFLGLDGNGEG